MFGLLGSCSLLSHSAQIFLVKIFLQQLEKGLMVLQYFVIDNTRMSIFWWEMFFNNSIHITFTQCFNHFLLLNTFSFLSLQTFLIINSTSSFLWQFELWIFWYQTFCFQVCSYFLSILWMLWMLVTPYKVKFTLSTIFMVVV